MTKPLISILIPVYKVEQYIEQCLRSLLSNTIIKECEVIVVDDCSPDRSMEVVHHVLEDFPALRNKVLLHSHDVNRGSAAARNSGLLQAQGRYIICVDSDDWVEPDYLEQLYNEAERTGADVVFCDLFQERAHSTTVIQEGKGSGDFLTQLLREEIHGWLPVKLIRRALLVENGITWVEGLDMCEDVLIMAKVFRHAKKVVHLSLPLYHYRCTNDNSLTQKLNTQKILQLQGVVRELETYLPTEYDDGLKSFKSKTKVWILKSADGLSTELLSLYNSDLLSRCRYNSLASRLFFFFCERRWRVLVRLILRLKGRKD
ncbi:MAG: glycosyltransferase [Spirochaetia bacterium]|nr:glycosyltransferase [Spirochaetia bacterium]